jgi:hypothetical protein
MMEYRMVFGGIVQLLRVPTPPVAHGMVEKLVPRIIVGGKEPIGQTVLAGIITASFNRGVETPASVHFTSRQ